MISEAASIELVSAKELFKVVPENVANVYIVMALVALQLQLLYVPTVDLGWHLRVCEVDVVASHAGKKLTLLCVVLPVSELPVLTIDEDSYNPVPPGVSEVRSAIIHIESDCLIANLSCH